MLLILQIPECFASTLAPHSAPACAPSSSSVLSCARKSASLWKAKEKRQQSSGMKCVSWQPRASSTCSFRGGSVSSRMCTLRWGLVKPGCACGRLRCCKVPWAEDFLDSEPDPQTLMDWPPRRGTRLQVWTSVYQSGPEFSKQLEWIFQMHFFFLATPRRFLWIVEKLDFCWRNLSFILLMACEKGFLLKKQNWKATDERHTL